jgi:DNA-binding NarL/FixJ family response regulator
VEKTVNAHRAQLTAAEPADPAACEAEIVAPPVVQPLPEKKIVVRMRERHTAVHQLRAQGLSKSAIGRRLGLHPATVRKIANAPTVDE